jgi:preprotein translocase subunit Sss1
VEVQTEEEQRAALIAAVGIVALGVLAVAAGLLLDPLDGF